MADIGWGHLTGNAEYGLPFDTSEDFKALPFQESLEKYKDYMHASHGMIYMKLDQMLWKQFPLSGAILVNKIYIKFTCKITLIIFVHL